MRCAFVLLALCTAPALWASDVAAGIDLWRTAPDNDIRYLTTDTVTVGPGFFGDNSDAVEQTMRFLGRPVITDPNYPSLGGVDTVLERTEDAHLTVCGSPATVPLRIAALHLYGGTLRVTYLGSSPEDWRVEVFLSEAAQDLGTLTLQQSCDEGGTLTSHFKVYPRFVFTRLSDNRQLVLDWNMYRDAAHQLEFTATGSWARSVRAGFSRITAAAGARVDPTGNGDWVTLPGTTDNFIVGMGVTPCSCSRTARFGRDTSQVFQEGLLLEQELLAKHIVAPPSQDNTSPVRAPRTRGGRNGEPPAAQGTMASQTVRLLPLGLLVFAAVFAIPWRRHRKPNG